MSEVEVSEMEDISVKDEKVVFKKKSRTNLRKRRDSDDDGTGKPPAEVAAVEEVKERQRMRNRPKGISVVGLALGKKLALEDELAITDPFNTKNGGLVNMQSLKSGSLNAVEEDAYDIGVGTQFSAETNKRDEDEEMMKYIENELQKRKGLEKVDGEEGEATKYLTPEEAALLALPEHLRQSTSHRSEEMLSNQMLNGIPEVELGIEAKIRNIEATEEAKQKMLRDQKTKKDGPSQFVPANMAVNFMQHNRFNTDENAEARRRQRENNSQQAKPHHMHGTGVKRATDDYYYDKFRKQYRRY